jgi:hypothetical protein
MCEKMRSELAGYSLAFIAGAEEAAGSQLGVANGASRNCDGATVPDGNIEGTNETPVVMTDRDDMCVSTRGRMYQLIQDGWGPFRPTRDVQNGLASAGAQLHISRVRDVGACSN